MKRTHNLLRCMALVAGLAAWSVAGHAACSTPDGNAGDVIYAANHNTLAFCDGTEWVSLGGQSTSIGNVLDDLSDVDTTGVDVGNILVYNGAQWVVSNSAGGGIGGDALGDRITSGTHVAVMNEASGYVSLSSAGTTWGYLSGGNSYLPTLVAGKVSAINVSATHIQLSSPTTPLACNESLAGSMRYTSGTMQVCDGTEWGNIGIGVPTGTIAAFAASSCPSGWTEYAPARGRFLRGIDTLAAGIDPSGTRAPGNVQADALQNITGSFNARKTVSNNFGITNVGGVFTRGAEGVTAQGMETGVLQNRETIEFNASRVARTANETRPKNVAVIFCAYSGFQSAPGQTILTTLASLTDVSIGGATPGQVLVFDGASWIASNTAAASTAEGDRITSGTTNIIAHQDGSLTFTTAGSQRMVIGENGRVGIGTTSPVADFNVNGVAYYPSFGQPDNPVGFVARRDFGGVAFNGAANANPKRQIRIPFDTAEGMNARITIDVVGVMGASFATRQSLSKVFYLVTDLSGNIIAQSSFTTHRVGAIIGISDFTVEGNELVLTVQYAGTNSRTFGIRMEALGWQARRILSATIAAPATGTVGEIPIEDVTVETMGALRLPDAVIVNSSSLDCGASTAGGIRYSGGAMQYCNGSNWAPLGGGGGSGGTVIAEGTISNLGTLEIGGIADYDEVVITLWNIRPATDNTNLQSRFKQGGSYVSAANSYRYGYTGGASTAEANATFMQFNSGMGSAAGELSHFTVKLVRPGASGMTKAMTFEGARSSTSGVIHSYNGAGYMLANTNPIEAIGFFFASGNIAEGYYVATGYKYNENGGDGATALADLTDVSVAGATPGQVLTFDGTEWVPTVGSGGGGEGDRITSGSHVAVINETTGNVSLSTGGTTWGYFGSGNSYLPSLVTGKVSASTISGTMIQVGSSEQACVAGIAGAIRYESNHLEYCNGSSWTPLGAGINPLLASVNFQGTGTVTIRNQHNVASITDNGTGDYTLHFAQPLPSTDYIVLTNASRDGTGGGLSGNILEGSQTSTSVRVQFRTTSGGSARDPEYAFVSILPADNILVGAPGGGGASALNELSDVNTSGASTGSILAYNGSSWVVSETTGGNALGDRITSGSHVAAINETSGYISLSTGGTTWGYLGSGNSYLPSLVAGKVSATNVSATLATAQRIFNGDGTAALPSYAFNGDTNTGLYAAAADSLGFSTGGVEQMLLNSTGLTVDGDVTATKFISNRMGMAGVYNSTQVQGIWSIGNAYAISSTANTFGNLYGLGYAHSTTGGGLISGQHQMLLVHNGTVNAALGFNGAAIFGSNVTAAAFLYSSDRRLKENVNTLTGGLAKLDALNPVTFTYISDTARRERLGLMAQDVETVYPQAVATGDDGMKSVDYPSLVPALVGAIKDLKAANDNVKASSAEQSQRIRDLEAANDNLREALHAEKRANDTLRTRQADILRRLEAMEARKAAVK